MVGRAAGAVWQALHVRKHFAIVASIPGGKRDVLRSAVVAVAGFCEGLDRGVRGEARQLLAADLVVRGQHPVPDELKQAVDAMPGTRRTDVLEMLTLVATPLDEAHGQGEARSQLVELKSLDGEYPYYGDLELDPPRPIAELLDAELDASAAQPCGRRGRRGGAGGGGRAVEYLGAQPASGGGSAFSVGGKIDDVRNRALRDGSPRNMRSARSFKTC